MSDAWRPHLATAHVPAVADDGGQVPDEDASCCSVTQSAPTSPVKQHGGEPRRGLARIFRGKPAGSTAIAVTATGSSSNWTPDMVARISSASELGCAISVSSLGPSLDPAERRRGLGRLLGRKRAAPEASPQASRAASTSVSAPATDVPDDGVGSPQQNRRRLFAGSASTWRNSLDSRLSCSTQSDGSSLCTSAARTQLQKS